MLGRGTGFVESCPSQVDPLEAEELSVQSIPGGFWLSTLDSQLSTFLKMLASFPAKFYFSRTRVLWKSTTCFRIIQKR